jgi:hypothetical protein
MGLREGKVGTTVVAEKVGMAIAAEKVGMAIVAEKVGMAVVLPSHIAYDARGGSTTATPTMRQP